MPGISREQLLAYMREARYAVQASVAAGDAPQAAVVGVSVSDTFEIVFDTLQTARKTSNLREHPHIALVLGAMSADASRTIQVEGVADEPVGIELETLLERYFTAFPDGRARRSAGNITYFRVRPTWIRCSDYSTQLPTIVEFTATDLA